MRTHIVVALLVGALSFLPAWAGNNKPEPAVNAGDKASFEKVAAQVRTEMDPGGRYSDVTKSDRAKVDAQLDLMDKQFQAKPDVSQMSPDEKTRMFNSQEEVNAILTKHDDQRLICTNDSPTGSHIPVRTCHTVRELAQQNQGMRERLRQTPGTLQLTTGAPAGGH